MRKWRVSTAGSVNFDRIYSALLNIPGNNFESLVVHILLPGFLSAFRILIKLVFLDFNPEQEGVVHQTH